MRFKRFTFSLLSPLLGFHYGKNPVSGQRFLHVAPVLFFGIDFEFKPYVNEQMKVVYAPKSQRGPEAGIDTSPLI